MMHQFFLSRFIVFAVLMCSMMVPHVWGTIAELEAADPMLKIVAINAISYEMGGSPAFLQTNCLPSQIYLDQNDATIDTAIAMVVPGGHIYDLRGIEVDFVLGRRPVGSSQAFNFTWDQSPAAKSIPIMLGAQFSVRVRIYVDCNQPQVTVPCGKIVEFGETILSKPASFYLFKRFGWADIMRFSYPIPLNPITSNTSYGYLISAPGLNDPATFWISVEGAVPQNYAGQELTFRTPVSAVMGATMAMRDVNQYLSMPHLVNWTATSNIAASPAPYGTVNPPAYGYRIAARDVPYDSVLASVPQPTDYTPPMATSDATSPSGANTSWIEAPLPFPTPSPEAAAQVNPPQAAAEGGGPSLIVIIIISVVGGICVTALLTMVVVALVRRHRREKYAYGPVEELPLTSPSSNGIIAMGDGDDEDDTSSTAEVGQSAGRAGRGPIKSILVGERVAEAVQVNATDPKASPRLDSLLVASEADKNQAWKD